MQSPRHNRIEVFFRTILLVGMACCAWCTQTPAQKVMRVEKEGRLKNWKFYTGDELYLKSVFSPDDWAKVVISEIRPDERTVQFDRTVLTVDEIRAIKPISRVQTGRWIKNKMLTFSAGLLLFSVADPLLGRSYEWWAPPAAGVSIVIGIGINKIVNTPFRFDKKHKLRLLDLRPPPTPN